MPLKKILDFLDNEEMIDGTPEIIFDRLEDGLVDQSAQDVAQAFNQIYINLAEHLNDEDYLQVASLFLNQLLGFMVAWSFSQSCSTIMDQCREIWSLVLAKCELSSQSVEKYRTAAAETMLTEDNWSRAFFSETGATRDEETMVSFASLLFEMGLVDNQDFLKLWTDNNFDVEPDFDSAYRHYRSQLGFQGLVACHALFSPVRHSEYGERAHRFVSRAITKEAEGFVEED